jgi:hypothetical protein
MGRKLLMFIAYFLSLLCLGSALASVSVIIPILNPVNCNNIWGTHVCPTLVAISPWSYRLPFISLAAFIALAYGFYKLAKFLSKLK